MLKEFDQPVGALPAVVQGAWNFSMKRAKQTIAAKTGKKDQRAGRNG